MQIAAKSNTAKIISGILATISIAVIARIVLPAVWFWIGFEVFAALLVAVGCGGEWYLHHHPAGRKKVEKEEHHKLESRFIAAVAVGVFMEFFSLGHAIPEAIKLEKEAADAQVQVKQLGVQIIDTSNIVAQADLRIALANTQASNAVQEAADANARAKKFDADRAIVEKEAEEIRQTNFVLQTELLQLEAKTGPRTITPDERTALLSNLKKCPKGKVFVEASILDAEATQYAVQIENVLTNSGFEVDRPSSFIDPNSILANSETGIHLVVKEPKTAPLYAAYLQKAFNDSGVELDGSIAGDTNFPTNKVEIAIGQHF